MSEHATKRRPSARARPERPSAPPPRRVGDWLLGRYWHFSAAILLSSSPLLLAWGTARDALGVASYVALTAAAWAIARRRPDAAVQAHLLALIPYWTWYSQLPGGLPLRLGPGVGEYLIMLLFPLMVITAAARPAVLAVAAGLALAGVLWRFEAITARGAGCFLIAAASLTGMVFRALTRQFEAAQEATRAMAYRDALTGLPNRRELNEWMRAGMRRGPGSLLYLDLDRFKTVNDVMGHAAGDVVLVEVCRRLSEGLRPTQLLARLGGDEFVVAERGAVDPAALALEAAALVARIGRPIDVSGREIHVGGSVGVALWPEHGDSLDAVLHAADTAMYRAKQRSLGVQWAEAATGKADHRGLEVELWGAAARGELSLHYQPVFELATRRIVGLEALLRWRHPTLGNVSPADFIPIAEDTGQIVGLDCWVLERGVAQLGAWAAGGYRGQVALNVSARSLGDERWMRALERTVEAQPALCRRLVLEVTESATMRDPEAVLGRIAALRELGIDIAIDDFGMGYSSLSYLRRIRATHLKLDRSFVHGIGLHRRDEELIELILELAARWQLVVVAEGVETAEQERWLRERGCPHAQGSGLARPTTAEAVGAMIAAPAALAVAV